MNGSDIFGSSELDEKSNVQKMHFGHSDKSIEFYNIDAINVPAISKNL